MMKKIVALILALAMIICCAAMAETPAKETLGTLNVNSAFQIKCQMPEGYKLAILSSDNSNIYAAVTSEEEGKPQLTLSIAFSDIFTEEDGTALRLNDLPEEDIEAIRADFREQLSDATFQDAETALGTRLLIVKGRLDADSSVVIFYSVYKSYEVELVATMGQDLDAQDLTEEQTQTIIDFLTNMDFDEIAE